MRGVSLENLAGTGPAAQWGQGCDCEGLENGWKTEPSPWLESCEFPTNKLDPGQMARAVDSLRFMGKELGHGCCQEAEFSLPGAPAPSPRHLAATVRTFLCRREQPKAPQLTKI